MDSPLVEPSLQSKIIQRIKSEESDSNGGSLPNTSGSSSNTSGSSLSKNSWDTEDDMSDEVRSTLQALRKTTMFEGCSKLAGALHFIGSFYLEHQELVEQYCANVSKPSLKQREKFVEEMLQHHRYYKKSLLVTAQDKATLLEQPVLISEKIQSSIVDIASGPNSWAAITAHGEVYMEGPKQLNFNCLGRTSKTDESSKLHILAGNKIIGIESGPFHTLAFSKDKVFTWGYNINCSTLGVRGEENVKLLQTRSPPTPSYQLGRDPQKPFDVPNPVKGIQGQVIRVSCGAAHSAALTTEGIFTWGLNDEGQLGHTEDPRFPNVVKSLLGKQVTQIACGAHHTLALLDNGWLYAWGWNAHQQLGFVSTSNEVCITAPRRVDALSSIEVTDIACGNTHSAALTASGAIWTWGSCNYGELGRKKGSGPKPVAIKGVRAITVDCGGDSTAIVSAVGDVWIWGRLVGEGFSQNQWEPRRLEQVHKKHLIVKKVAVGYCHVSLLVEQQMSTALQTLAKACRSEGEVALSDLKNKFSFIEPREMLTTMQNRIHEEMYAARVPKPCLQLRSAIITFADDNLSSTIHIRNIRKKPVTITLSVPSRELPRGDTIEYTPKTLDIKPRSSGTFTLTFKAGDGMFGSHYFNVISLMAESERKKVKVVSQCFVEFSVNVANGKPRRGSINTGGSSGAKDALQSAKKEIVLYERLGSGGSGASVFRCTINGHVCAVKILDMSQTPDDAVENFIKEIKLIEGLQHPNIISYIGHDLVDGNMRCFMDYYPYTLTSLIKKKRSEPFSPRECATICLEMAKGLHYLHNLKPKIIHRDLKSANILMSMKDDGVSIKEVRITDFDASAITNNARLNVTVIGTSAWMAPEVFTKEGYTVAADIWSFAMVLFEMLSLKQPYFQVKPIRVVENIIAGVLPEFPAPLDDIYTPLVDMMKKCLVVDADQRPSAEALIEDLNQMLKIFP